MFNSYQEAYDKTVDMLEEQGIKSYIPVKGCVYYSGKACCAIGLHIQEVYSPIMDAGVGNNVYGLIENFPRVKPYLEINNTLDYKVSNFWYLIQVAHDSSVNLEDFNKSLISIAKKYELKPKQLTKWEIV